MNEKQNETLLDKAPTVAEYVRTERKSNNLFLYLSACTACLSSFTTGILWVWTSPVLPKLDGSVDPTNNPIGRPITPQETAWIAGLLSLGSVTSPIIAGRLTDKIGRKKSLLIIASPMLVALLIAAFANTVLLFYVSRVLMGLGTGGVLTIIPMFLGEIAEDSNRGRITALNSVFTCLGMLFTFVVGPHLTVRNFCLVCAIPLVVFMSVFSICIPESPHFFALIEDQEGLKSSLSKLRRIAKEDTEDERIRIINTVHRKMQHKSTFKDLFKYKESRKAFFLTLNVVLLQIFSGSNAIFGYMQTIFAASGNIIEPKNCPIVIASVQTLMVMFSSSLVDKLGRRILILTSLIGCGLSLISLGVYFHLQSRGFNVDVIFWLPITCLLVYVVSLSVGLRIIPFILQAEMFPPHFKASASVLTALTRSIGSFITTWSFPLVSVFLGMATTFYIFAAICFVGVISVFWTLPETKGKSLQEIQRILEGRKVQNK